MRRSRFSETHIITILKEADAGMKFGVLYRMHGISVARHYKLMSKYVGMEAYDLKCVCELEAENAKLMRMYTDFALENMAIGSHCKKL